MDDAHFFWSSYYLTTSMITLLIFQFVAFFLHTPSYRMNLKNLHPIHFVLQVCVSWVKSTINSENSAEFWLILWALDYAPVIQRQQKPIHAGAADLKGIMRKLSSDQKKEFIFFLHFISKWCWVIETLIYKKCITNKCCRGAFMALDISCIGLVLPLLQGLKNKCPRGNESWIRECDGVAHCLVQWFMVAAIGRNLNQREEEVVCGCD